MDVETEITAIKVTLGAHEQRFSNGIHVMGEMKDDIKQLKPKTPDWLKLVGLLAALMIAFAGAQAVIADKFADRPRWDQMDNALRPIRSAQDRTGQDVQDIKESQAGQAASVKAIEQAQKDLGEKLDKALNQPRGRR